MKPHIYVLSILVLLIFACSSEDNRKEELNNKPNTEEAIQTIQTITHNNEEREYLIYVPKTYTGTSEVPLLFNFHGFTGNVNSYINKADMRSVAEEENFILVYPQGSLIQGLSHWNPSLPSADNKSDADDLGFVEALIEELRSDYNIDSKRIYACGFSNGGMMSFGLASHKSDLFAAVGSISGAMLDTDVLPIHPMPVIIFHGTSDFVLPYNGSSEYRSIDMVLNFWVDYNNTNSTPIFETETDNDTVIEYFQYNQGDNDVSVEHYKIIDGNHTWFDINYQGSNTSELIWDFFSIYDIDGLK